MMARAAIADRRPGPGGLAPAGVRRFSVRFDRPMCRSRGRVRLTWGRISAHFVNQDLRRYHWSLQDPELCWDRDGLELSLTLPEPLTDGFRVRVEWSDVVCEAAGLPPVPDDREAGLRYVVAVGRAAVGGGPRLSSLPDDGDTGVRRDVLLEVFPDRPVGRLDVDQVVLQVDGQRIRVRAHTNRNPPDWIFLHPAALLPAGAEVSLRIPCSALVGTNGAPMAEDWSVSFTTAADDPCVPVVCEDWSEPPAGAGEHPLDCVQVALRFAGRPVLAPLPALQQQVALLDGETGEPVPGILVSHDPTPGHYRTVFLQSHCGFTGLQPGRRYDIRWRSLADAAWPTARAGQRSFTTAEADAHPQPLAPLAAAGSIFATASGSFLQLMVPVYATRPLAAAWVEVDRDGAAPVRMRLEPVTRHGFTDVMSNDRMRTRPMFYQLPRTAAPLPPSRHPMLRSFRLLLTDAGGHTRRFSGQAFDMGPQAIVGLRLKGRVLRWSREAPCDVQHLCMMSRAGEPIWSGLFAASASQAEVPAELFPGPGTYLVQMWLIRARPSDDLWDYGICMRVITVVAN